jgi:hypothetical protein
MAKNVPPAFAAVAEKGAQGEGEGEGEDEVRSGGVDEWGAYLAFFAGRNWEELRKAEKVRGKAREVRVKLMKGRRGSRLRAYASGEGAGVER